jgi:DUF1680 family protein
MSERKLLTRRGFVARAGAAAATLRLRIPWWATRGGMVSVNGSPLPAFASPSSYLTLTRTVKDA